MDFPEGTDLWVNARIPDLDDSHGYLTVVRLRPGNSLPQLLSAGNLSLSALGRIVPAAAGRELVLTPFLSSLVGDLRPILLIVLAATLLLLLLACVNVTNLLLARGAAQAHEIAMRTALGARRSHVIRQLVTQSLVLSAAGTLAGLAVASVSVRLLLTLAAGQLPRLDAVPFDWRVLSFVLGVLIVSGVAMGVLPALRGSDTDLKTVLNEHGRRTTSSAATSRAMSGLIVAEVALAIALVAGAGWLIQSFARLRAVDPGFATDGRLVIEVRATRTFASAAEVRQWAEGVQASVRRAAGDAVIGAAVTFPLGTDHDGGVNIELPPAISDPNHPSTSRMRLVTPGFFEGMAIDVVSGRSFTDDDRGTTQRVVVINRAFARRYFQDRDPLGAVVAHGFPKPDLKDPAVVVGVVDDVRYKALTEAAEATLYVPEAQGPYSSGRWSMVVYRGGGASEALIPQIRDALTQFDPGVMATYETADAIVGRTLWRQELGMSLMLVFGATALALAAVGLYGVIAYVAAQRRAELATRIALGASMAQVFWLMMRDGQRLVLLGVALGLGATYAGGRLVAGNIFAMQAADPVVLAAASVVVAVVAWFATMIPAVKVSRQDPVRALRD